MSNKLSITTLLLLLTGCATTSTNTVDKKPVLQSDLQQSSYAQGVQYMTNMQQSDIPLDQDLFLLGMHDVLNKSSIRLNPEQLQKGQDWVFVQQVLYNNKIATENLNKGKVYLDANKQKPGIHITASGLQYKILVDGKGARKPTINDTAYVHYRITRLDGKELTSTNKATNAPEVQVSRLIKGWQEGLMLMPEGAKWQLYVPAELAYGEAGAPGKLGPNETLIYEVELVGIKPATTKVVDKTTTSFSSQPSSKW